MEAEDPETRKCPIEKNFGLSRSAITLCSRACAQKVVMPDSKRETMSYLQVVLVPVSAGSRFRILAEIEEFSRENLVLIAGLSIAGARIVREPQAFRKQCGFSQLG